MVARVRRWSGCANECLRSHVPGEVLSSSRQEPQKLCCAAPLAWDVSCPNHATLIVIKRYCKCVVEFIVVVSFAPPSGCCLRIPFWSSAACANHHAQYSCVTSSEVSTVVVSFTVPDCASQRYRQRRYFAVRARK